MNTIKLWNARANESHESSLSNGRVQPSIVLNNGVEMPQIGYGVYQVTPEECALGSAALLAKNDA